MSDGSMGLRLPMTSEIQGVICLVFGALSMAFARRLAEHASRFQKTVFRHDASPGMLRWGYFLGGAVFVVVGTLAALGVVRFRT